MFGWRGRVLSKSWLAGPDNTQFSLFRQSFMIKTELELDLNNICKRHPGSMTWYQIPGINNRLPYLAKVIATGHIDIGIIAFCLTFGHTIANILYLFNRLPSSHVSSSNVINTESFPMRKHGMCCNLSSLSGIHAFEVWQPISSCLWPGGFWEDGIIILMPKF